MCQPASAFLFFLSLFFFFFFLESLSRIPDPLSSLLPHLLGRGAATLIRPSGLRGISHAFLLYNYAHYLNVVLITAFEKKPQRVGDAWNSSLSPSHTHRYTLDSFAGGRMKAHLAPRWGDHIPSGSSGSLPGSDDPGGAGGSERARTWFWKPWPGSSDPAVGAKASAESRSRPEGSQANREAAPPLLL